MLKHYLSENNISLYRLSRQTGIPYSTVSNLANGTIAAERCSAGNLFKIAQALGLTMDEAFRICKQDVPWAVSINVDGIEIFGDIVFRGQQAFISGVYNNVPFCRPVCRALGQNLPYIKFLAETELMNQYLEAGQ